LHQKKKYDNKCQNKLNSSAAAATAIHLTLPWFHQSISFQVMPWQSFFMVITKDTITDVILGDTAW